MPHTYVDDNTSYYNSDVCMLTFSHNRVVTCKSIKGLSITSVSEVAFGKD